MPDRLLEYFSECRNPSFDGSRGLVGLEIETDFEMFDGQPISAEVSQALIRSGHIADGEQRKLELGRQKIELVVAPCGSIQKLLTNAYAGLGQLYADAFRLGARPRYTPEIITGERLLYVAEERDELWVSLDGAVALEELCRCSSVQFTIDVAPRDAISTINRLWAASVQTIDYTPNDQRWQNYMASSQAGYLLSRYGGPAGFASLEDYVQQLKRHKVVMHQGAPCELYFDEVDTPNIDLFLRSVWWHYRLRRYGDTLTVEIRPFARRRDIDIADNWRIIAAVLGTSDPSDSPDRYRSLAIQVPNTYQEHQGGM